MPNQKIVRIAGVQGFYGDSPMGAMNIVMENAADYLVHDALAELTLSILQKDKLKNPQTGYAKDIEVLAKILYPAAFAQGIKIVTNSGGLNPQAAALKVSEILKNNHVTGIKIAIITGDNLIDQLKPMQDAGLLLENLDTQIPYHQSPYQPTHANAYIGAKSIKEALDNGANLILAGRVADPCLTLGILAHEFQWPIENCDNNDDLDKLASGIAIGHLLECGGQASGGNSYAEWNHEYPIWNLGYPIAHVKADGSAIFTKTNSSGGKISRNTLREQLVYEIHNPAHYITPDVIVNLTQVEIEEIEENKVLFKGAKGKPRPEKLKLTIGQMEGYLSEQFFFFSYPYAFKKSQKFIDAVNKIWDSLPISIERRAFNFIGLNGMHGTAAPTPNPEWIDNMNEIGVRVTLKHKEEKTGKIAMAAITCLGLNGPPGIISMPGWGKINRLQLSLWPTLIPRSWVNEKIDFFTT